MPIDRRPLLKIGRREMAIAACTLGALALGLRIVPPVQAQSPLLEGEGFPYSAFDALAQTQLEVGGGVIRVAFAPGKVGLGKSAILDWVRRAATAVTVYYGRLPAPSVRVLIAPVEGGGVQGGTTWGYQGAAILMRLGSTADANDLAHDWMMTHEMVHTALPDMPARHNWLSEGLAVYIEPIARVQAGFLSAAQIWSDMVRDMPKGLPRAGDRGLDATPTWGRTYWGGALFCLLADLDIRRTTDNRLGLQQAMRGVLAAGGNHDVDWPIQRILTTADKAVGTTTMTTLYDRFGLHSESTDLPALWRSLGIEGEAGSLRFRDDAPLAVARRAITARPPAG